MSNGCPYPLIAMSSEASGRNANKVVLYEDASKKQLQEFISALRGCELMNHACFLLSGTLENINFGPLHHLLTPGKLARLSFMIRMVNKVKFLPFIS